MGQTLHYLSNVLLDLSEVFVVVYLGLGGGRWLRRGVSNLYVVRLAVVVVSL